MGSALPVRVRRTRLSLEDRTALSQALALLGRSPISNNLSQLARLANVSALSMTPETEAELHPTLADVREVRRFLMTARGLKMEVAR